MRPRSCHGFDSIGYGSNSAEWYAISGEDTDVSSLGRMVGFRSEEQRRKVYEDRSINQAERKKEYRSEMQFKKRDKTTMTVQ